MYYRKKQITILKSFENGYSTWKLYDIFCSSLISFATSRNFENYFRFVFFIKLQILVQKGCGEILLKTLRKVPKMS